MSGVKAGLEVEHYYLHTHTHMMQPGHLTVESRADALLLCPSKQQTHTRAAHSLLFIQAFKGRINREEEKERKREKDERRGRQSANSQFY